MTRTNIIFSSAALFFALGLGWGFWSNHSSAGFNAELIVLCPKTWLPTETTEEISRRLKIRVVQLDFDTWSEFVRLTANTQGKADVICFHSFLAHDLIQSKFLEKAQFKNLPRFRHVSVDFLRLPFDPDFEFTAPLFWGVNGFVIKDVTATTWKSVWPAQGQKMSLLYPDLELLWRMRQNGLEIHEEDNGDDNSRKLNAFVQTFFKTLSDVSSNRPDPTPADLNKFQIIQLSSGPAAMFLKDHPDWKYWLPTDGVSLWFGMAGIGAQSRFKAQAKDFINELLRPDRALAIHKTLNHGVVQASLDSNEQVLPMQRTTFIREIPLDRVRFPDLTLEILPRWERLVSEAKRL